MCFFRFSSKSCYSSISLYLFKPWPYTNECLLLCRKVNICQMCFNHPRVIRLLSLSYLRHLFVNTYSPLELNVHGMRGRGCTGNRLKFWMRKRGFIWILTIQLTLWPWISNLTFLTPSFLICVIDVIKLALTNSQLCLKSNEKIHEKDMWKLYMSTNVNFIMVWEVDILIIRMFSDCIIKHFCCIYCLC